MQPLSPESVTVDEIDLPCLKENGIRLSVLRLDKIHPVISGNKWFKLKYHLKKAKAEGKNHIVTFGGAYSNHIIATAACGALFRYGTSAIVRGEEPAILSQTLSRAAGYGMQLHFISRQQYRHKILPPPILATLDDIFLINEGGYGEEGIRGAAEILDLCKKDLYSHIACAVGTSTMLAGIIRAALPEQQVIGISVLGNRENQEDDITRLLLTEHANKKNQIDRSHGSGGYARYKPELINFMNGFYRQTGIPLDFVYTGKLFYAIVDSIKKQKFPANSHILVIHSGGLQGNMSLPKGMLIF